MFAKRFLLGLASSLMLAATLAAAPGRLTPAGPFGTLDPSVEELVFPGSDAATVLLRTPSDLFLSRDGGFSWRSVLSSTPQIRPAALAIDGADPRRWYVTDAPGAASGVWQTADGGVRWSALPLPVLPAGRRELSFFADRFQPANLALEVFLPEAASYRRYVSRDRGQSWTELPLAGLATARAEILGLNDGSLYLHQQRYELATGGASPVPLETVRRMFFDRFRPGTSYLLAESPFGPDEALYVSTDRGAGVSLLRTDFAGIRFLIQSPADGEVLAMGDAFGLDLSDDRGQRWNSGSLQPASVARQAAFTPDGELLLAGERELVRRSADGILSAPLALHGLLASTIVALDTDARSDTALAIDLAGRAFIRDRFGVWHRTGSLSPDGAAACLGEKRLVLLPRYIGYAVLACEESGIFFSNDFGWTWTRTPSPARQTGGNTFDLAATESEIYLLAGDETYHTSAFGTLVWERVYISPNTTSAFAVHPDPARGVIAIGGTGGVSRRLPGERPDVHLFWLAGGGVAPGAGGRPHSKNYPYLTAAHDRAHPDLIYAIHGSVLSRSRDFGIHWEVMSDLFFSSPLGWDEDLQLTEAIIDPFDADHLLLLGRGLETRDGGRTFFASDDAFGPAAFDRETPGLFLQAQPGRGVLERSAAVTPCLDDYIAFCAGGDRYLLTVEWKDHEGRRDLGRKIQTGNDGSGVFYFFHSANWELLVKVLDGCAINDRQWLFAAGTTDVEYVLRVQDRWTGQIRHYANQPGQPAPAITDTEAFAGCAATPPPGADPAPLEALGAAAGEPALDLLAGRFEVTTRWTNFAGQEGAGLTTSLQSENTGLFYFFDPNNWEMLVKVLDGCAINDHYWLLAAATTDVGYELKVRDREAGITKTYRNPVGRAAPATIDLQAFACTSAP